MIAIDHLSVLSKHESDQILHGLSRVGIDYPCSGWVLKLEWNPLHPRTPLAKSAGLLLFLSPLSIFFFGSDFAIASSLASAQYLIRTNSIVILIRLLGCHL